MTVSAMSTRFLAPGSRARVKFCGITRHSDAVLAAELGADAIGLVFYPPSPRAVSLSLAEQVVSGLPPSITVVALFVDAGEQYIRQVISALPVDMLQFHGSEDPASCGLYNLPYIKALRPDPRFPGECAPGPYHEAFAILWDTYSSTVPGGSGQPGDWDILPGLMSHQRNIVAGGLNPGNVAAAIKATRPYAVDVSSGIEQSAGIKCPELMSNFIKEVSNVS